MNRRFALIATSSLLTSVAASSCGRHVEDAGFTMVEGVLLLKGSEPHVHWVLVVSETEQWELRGLNKAFAQSLQTRRVRVTGRITPDARSALLLPILVVHDLGLSKN